MILKYQYQFTDIPPITEDQGTGYDIKFTPYLADPPSVADVSKPLRFKNDERRIPVISLPTFTPNQPNWYGIAFRHGIQTFTSVNIFFHPSPAGAGMNDAENQGRTGKWPPLFRYAQNLGFQFDAGNCDQVLVVPFFSYVSYLNGGIFTSNWSEILLVIINAVKAVALWQGPPQGPNVDVTAIAQGALVELQRTNVPPIEVKNVVLSCFSFGRVPMMNFKTKAMPSLDPFLREIWDFDGTGTPLL